jgi:hypothetical protein
MPGFASSLLMLFQAFSRLVSIGPISPAPAQSSV